MLIDLTQAPKCIAATNDPYLTSLEATYPPRPFRLFDLPRELRDNIYDSALVENATFTLEGKAGAAGDATSRPEDALDEPVEPPSELPSLNASVKFRASTNLLLAGHSLRHEYEERAKQSMIIILKDNDRYAFQPISLPEHATKVQNLELHLICFCHLCPTISHIDDKTCHAALELEQHRLWIDKLLPDLKELKALAVHAYICHDRYKPDSKHRLPCERIVATKFAGFQSVPKAKKLTLSRYDFQANPDLNGPKAIILEWPAKASMQVEQLPQMGQLVEDVEKPNGKQ